MVKHPIKAYNRATHTVAKTRQVVMLYDGAIRFLSQAQEAIAANQIEQRFTKLSKASEIVSGLQGCLDFESGRAAAQVLYDFYAGIDLRIMQLHRTNDAEACGKIIAELKSMRDVWSKIDRGDESQTPPPSDEGVQPVTVSA